MDLNLLAKAIMVAIVALVQLLLTAAVAAEEAGLMVGQAAAAAEVLAKANLAVVHLTHLDLQL